MKSLSLSQKDPIDCIVVPFPAALRMGHAQKIAVQLSRCRSSREAAWVLERTMTAFRSQMEKAYLSLGEIEDQSQAFLGAILHECDEIGARWRPLLSPGDQPEQNGGGAA